MSTFRSVVVPDGRRGAGVGAEVRVNAGAGMVALWQQEPGAAANEVVLSASQAAAVAGAIREVLDGDDAEGGEETT